jgi:hypothetical protein
MLAVAPHVKTTLVAQAREMMLQHVLQEQAATEVALLAATELQVALTLAETLMAE